MSTVAMFLMAGFLVHLTWNGIDWSRSGKPDRRPENNQATWIPDGWHD